MVKVKRMEDNETMFCTRSALMFCNHLRIKLQPATLPCLLLIHGVSENNNNNNDNKQRNEQSQKQKQTKKFLILPHVFFFLYIS